MSHIEGQPFSSEETGPSDELNLAFTELVSSFQRSIDERGWLEGKVKFGDKIHRVKNYVKLFLPPYSNFSNIYTLSSEMLETEISDKSIPVGEYQTECQTTLDSYTYFKNPLKPWLIHSTLYTASLLTMYKVPGYDNDPQRLLDDLVHQGIFSKLSRIVPPRTIGDLGHKGGILPNPLLRYKQMANWDFVETLSNITFKREKINSKIIIPRQAL